MGLGERQKQGQIRAVNCILDWMDICSKTHPQCGISQPAPLPYRVVFLDRREAYLYESKGEIRPYAALSHCWQDSQPLRTTKQNLRDHSGRLVWNSLPVAFREAFELVKALGIQYIWIDSLCIVQDDDDDWKTQAMRMASIYENAKVTISLHQKGTNSSSFTVRDANSSDAAANIQLYCKGFFWDPLWLNREMEQTRLASRGWCFQERLLSTRILHCLQSGIVFECNQGSACDCSNDEPHYHSDSDFKTLFTEERMTGNNWRQLITLFSQKSFTYQTDVLPALSGITNRVRDAGEYYGGSWEKFLPYDLLWFSSLGLLGSRVDLPTRPKEFIAPSFLWSSMKGHIAFINIDGDARFEKTFDIQCVECIPKNYDCLGQLNSGYLAFTGRYLFAKYVHAFERPMPASVFIKDCQPGLQCLWATMQCAGEHYIFHPDSLDQQYNGLICVEMFQPAKGQNEKSYALVISIAYIAPDGSMIRGKRVGVVASITGHHFNDATRVKYVLE
jgi:hypothetical protein